MEQWTHETHPTYGKHDGKATYRVEAVWENSRDKGKGKAVKYIRASNPENACEAAKLVDTRLRSRTLRARLAHPEEIGGVRRSSSGDETAHIRAAQS